MQTITVVKICHHCAFYKSGIWPMPECLKRNLCIGNTSSCDHFIPRVLLFDPNARIELREYPTAIIVDDFKIKCSKEYVQSDGYLEWAKARRLKPIDPEKVF